MYESDDDDVDVVVEEEEWENKYKVRKCRVDESEEECGRWRSGKKLY